MAAGSRSRSAVRERAPLTGSRADREGFASTGALAAVLLLAACGGVATGGSPCTLATAPVPIAGPLAESSGVVVSRTHPGVFWTHNDSGDEAVLYAVDAGGRLLGRVPVTGARNQDWEDIAVGPCPAGSCLYVGDIGDNMERRPRVFLYRVPEPAPGDSATAPADRYTLVYPAGARDAEALFVLPDASVHIVTKGRSGPVEVYRAALPATPEDPVPLELVQALTDGPPSIPRRVTGADASPDGTIVAIRTLEIVQFFDVVSGSPGAGPSGVGADSAGPPTPGAPVRLVPREGGVVNLRPLGAPQGEGVGVGEGGLVVLTSEAGPIGGRGSVVTLACEAVP